MNLNAWQKFLKGSVQKTTVIIFTKILIPIEMKHLKQRMHRFMLNLSVKKQLPLLLLLYP